MREFEQMVMQFFVRPGKNKVLDYWKNERLNWYSSIGISDNNLKYHDHEKLAHYANAATDIEYKFPFDGRKLKVFTLEQISTYLVIQMSQEKNSVF